MAKSKHFENQQDLQKVPVSVGTVKMVRSKPICPGGPTVVDVHPDEVENMKMHDWKVAE